MFYNYWLCKIRKLQFIEKSLIEREIIRIIGFQSTIQNLSSSGNQSHIASMLPNTKNRSPRGNFLQNVG